MRQILAAVIVIGVASLEPGSADRRSDLDRGHIGLGLALRRLATTGTFMMATAHPDDENNALLAMLSRGFGMRTVLATATRGDGGQNEIGPELFDALAALRTEELLAAHRIDAAEQLFTRAVDFGYSFSIEETFERWGKEEILGDFVRLIRMTRPDVIVGLRPDGAGGGQHHQASARLAREAFRSAGDPAKFPDQIAQGLRPWQAAKFYFMGPFGFRGEPPPDPSKKFVTINLETYDPLLGRTYAEMGSEARAMHKCQGFGQLLALPGRAVARYELVDSTIAGQMQKTETTLFDGVDTTLPGLARDWGAQTPNGGGSAASLTRIADLIAQAQAAFQAGEEAAVSRKLADGLALLRSERKSLATAGLDDSSRYEIDFRLGLKERQFEEALLLAQHLRIELLADDGVVVPGQPLKVTVTAGNRGEQAAIIRSVRLGGFDAGAECRAEKAKPEEDAKPKEVEPGGTFTCAAAARVPSGGPSGRPTEDVYWRRVAGVDRYEFAPDVPFGAPFRPTSFTASLSLVLSGASIEVTRPIEYRYEGNIFSGEKRMELKVVPAFGVAIGPGVAIVGRDPGARVREMRVTVTNRVKGSASGDVALRAPDGWTVTPEHAPVSFTREDEAQTLRFSVRPPAGVKEGEYRLDATVGEVGGSAIAALGAQVIEYPHIQRRHLLNPAVVPLKAIDVRIAPNLQVGYVMGVGDAVPQAIEQLGATVEMLDADDLAWGDLSRFDVIVTGVRAYERRADLRAHNHRLLDYAAKGGVVIVQYNKFEFNEAQYGPKPAKVSNNRVTDERAPVRIVDPSHPIFRSPNPIGPEAWEGWVQERGLYFLGDRDPGYTDLVEITDPFEYNPGPKGGALVEAKVGRGRWIYVGLGLWRQLPAGTPGAYLLLANLLSLAG
jgi:LmbE family N-acetylglucosaminyl deacetylase